MVGISSQRWYTTSDLVLSWLVYSVELVHKCDNENKTALFCRLYLCILYLYLTKIYVGIYVSLIFMYIRTYIGVPLSLFRRVYTMGDSG